MLVVRTGGKVEAEAVCRGAGLGLVVEWRGRLTGPTSYCALRLESFDGKRSRLDKRLVLVVGMSGAGEGRRSGDAVELELRWLLTLQMGGSGSAGCVGTAGAVLLSVLVRRACMDKLLSFLATGELVEAANEPTELTCEAGGFKLFEDADETRTAATGGGVACAVDAGGVGVEDDDLVDARFVGGQSDGGTTLAKRFERSVI